MRSVGIRWVDPRGAPAEQAWRIAVCLHAGLHGAHAHEQRLELDTAKLSIELADWFAAQQLEILSVSREKARRETWDEVLSLLADRPKGIRANDVYRARIVRNADEAHALLAEMRSIAPSRLCSHRWISEIRFWRRLRLRHLRIPEISVPCLLSTPLRLTSLVELRIFLCPQLFSWSKSAGRTLSILLRRGYGGTWKCAQKSAHDFA